MSQKRRDELKPRFESGTIPTQQDFWNLLDSFWNILDDGTPSGGSEGTMEGTSGSSGIDGISGTSGSSGVRGPSGTSGSSGNTGTSGSSGFSGSSGTSGLMGTSGSSGTSASSYTYPSDLVVSLSGGKTFGKYSNGNTIPSTGKTPGEVIQMAVFENVVPTATLTSSSTVSFNQTNVSNILNFSYVINTPGASISTAVLEWNRTGSSSWFTLSTSIATPGTYTHNYTDSNYNSASFNYRYTVTDTSSSVTVVTKTITPASYIAPTITLAVSGDVILSPETNIKRELGNVASHLSGNITRNSPFVNLSNYTLQYSTNNSTWIDIGSSVSVGPGSSTIGSTAHNDISLITYPTIYYRAKVVDGVQTTFGGNLSVSFLLLGFYGPSATTPSNSTSVRSLGSRIFSDSIGSFTLNTGVSYSIFTVAIPSSHSLVSVIDQDASNANVTSTYNLNTFNVQDYGGNNSSYKVYTANYALAYSLSHRHLITTS